MEMVYYNSSKMELHNWFIKCVRILTVPLFNILPSFLIRKIMRATSSDAVNVIDNVGSAVALEVMYTRYDRNIFAKGFWRGIGNLFWHNLVSQSKAARNRLRIVEDILGKEILRYNLREGKDKSVNFLTIGGGSCRAIIESVSKFLNQYPGLRIKITNIDKSQQAIDLGKELARSFNVSQNFFWVNDKASNLTLFVGNDSISIVEMVGLLDYFSDEKAIEVISQVYNCLKKGGLFITGNVYPHSEMVFINKIGWPKMYYRKKREIVNIFEKAGFSLKETEFFLEPLKSHIVAIVRK